MKNWAEASVLSCNASNILAVKSSNQKAAKKNMHVLNNIKGHFLEKNSWSDAPDYSFPILHGSNSTMEMMSLISADEHNSYSYPLGDISHTGEPSFFVTNQIYCWSDLGDFEDIDSMFSNGSSTFRIGDICKEEELSCFLSSHDAEGFEELSKFPSSNSSSFGDVLGHNEYQTPNSPVNHSNAEKGSFHIVPGSDLSSDCNEPMTSVGHLTFMDGIETISRNKNEFKSIYQTQTQTQNEMEQSMHHNQSSKRKRKDFCLETGNGVDHTATSHSQSRIDSYGYLQDHVILSDPYNEHHHSDQFSIMPSSTNLENNGLVYLPDQVKPSESSSYQLSFEAPNEKMVKDNHFSCRSDPTYKNFQEQTTEQSLLHKETSHRDSHVDEISLEESSFQRLQQIMEKLDGRTKLSIRDGLYRLARNAEKRNNHATLIDCSDDIGDASGSLMTEVKSNGFMNTEADTNPVDRSIAHLLFHKQSNSPGSITSHDHPFVSV